MYALVCWSITGGDKPRKNYFTYKTDIKDLEKGDVVLLEHKHNDAKMGVFVGYLEEDRNLHNLKRVNIIKKVHTNTLKAHLRKRYNEFKNFELSTSRRKRTKRKKVARTLFNSDDQSYLHWKIMRIICFGNRIDSEDGVTVTASFYYKNKRVVLDKQNGTWYLRRVEVLGKKVKWVRPTKSHYILVDLFKAEETPRNKL